MPFTTNQNRENDVIMSITFFFGNMRSEKDEWLLFGIY